MGALLEVIRPLKRSAGVGSVLGDPSPRGGPTSYHSGSTGHHLAARLDRTRSGPQVRSWGKVGMVVRILRISVVSAALAGTAVGASSRAAAAGGARPSSVVTTTDVAPGIPNGGDQE